MIIRDFVKNSLTTFYENINGIFLRKSEQVIVEGSGVNSARMKNGSATGEYSFAEGYNTTASGYYSHAENSGTRALGYCAHAEGDSTAASGSCSHAEGSGTTASGNFSHAEGLRTTALGYYSHAENSGTRALGYCAHAEGSGTTASGNFSHAEGFRTTASGTSSHAEGYDTKASGEFSHTEGSNTTASRYNSHAEGQGTTASGNYSHAEGQGTIASGECSHAEGSGTTASGNHSHAEGENTTASGNYSHAEGSKTTASGSCAHAEGWNTTASKTCSHAEGFYTITQNRAEHAEGQYNVSHSASSEYGNSGNTQHSVGIGRGDGDRKNAFEIMQNGGIYVNGVGMYDGNSLASATTLQDFVNANSFYFVDGTSSQPGNNTSGHYLATKWEGTITGINAATDGLKVAYRIRTNPGVSTAGAVLSVDGVNYYPVVYGVNTNVTNNYPVNSTILVVFNSSQSATTYLTENVKTTVVGCWQIMLYIGPNTIAYQVRTNYSTKPAHDQTGRYRLLFSSVDNSKWVPANTATTTNTTSVRPVNQTPINPFGEISYYGYTTIVNPGATVASNYLWKQYPLTLGYSFNNNGGSLNLVYPGNVYIKCLPQEDGSAIIDATTPYVQSLPNSEDGYIYIYLGAAYSSDNIELIDNHTVYYYKNGAIRIWTNGDTYWKNGSGEKSIQQNGSGTIAGGIASVAEGSGTTTLNQSEHAEGQFNLSHSATTTYGSSGNTQHSVGIGTGSGTTPKKNAFEIMQNGDIYIVGIGGYDGTNAAQTGVKTLQQILTAAGLA